jgi:GNAT superfamily N-acetyltransferase
MLVTLHTVAGWSARPAVTLHAASVSSVTASLIRPAAPADLERLPAIEAAGDALFAAAGIGPLPPAPTDPAHYAGARMILVVGDPAVGFASLDEVDGAAHLEQISVLPDHGRSGHGAALLEAACAWAAERYDVMTLCTFAEVPWNRPFYARHGFEVIDDLGPGLQALRAKEARVGLDALGTRVVMRRRLERDVMSG